MIINKFSIFEFDRKYKDILEILNESTVPSFFNVKTNIDSSDQIKNISSLLHNGDDYEDFINRLKIIEDPFKLKGNRTKKLLQCAIILQFLREIRHKYNASVAGFLAEYFFCGLIFGKVSSEGSDDQYNKSVDIDSNSGDKYQVKLLKKGSSNPEIDPEDYDVIIINIKSTPNIIETYIIKDPKSIYISERKGRVVGMFRLNNKGKVELNLSFMKNTYDSLIENMGDRAEYRNGLIDYVQINFDKIDKILSSSTFKNINDLYTHLTNFNDMLSQTIRGDINNQYYKKWNNTNLLDNMENRLDDIKNILRKLR